MAGLGILEAGQPLTVEAVAAASGVSDKHIYRLASGGREKLRVAVIDYGIERVTQCLDVIPRGDPPLATAEAIAAALVQARHWRGHLLAIRAGGMDAFDRVAEAVWRVGIGTGADLADSVAAGLVGVALAGVHPRWEIGEQALRIRIIRLALRGLFFGRRTNPGESPGV